MKKFYSFCAGLFLLLPAFAQSPVIIGTTTYDFQTYGSNTSHLIAYPDGKISASWMGSDGFAAGFTDLGTFYNHFNGASWGAFPSSRVETIKTYSTDMLKVLEHEMILADDVGELRMFENAAVGGGSWSEPSGTNVLDQWYNITFCPPGTDDIYVVGVKPPGGSGISEDLLFSRSDNGGDSWAVTEYALPFTTEAYGCEGVLPGAYQIAVKGSDVYVVYGSVVSDLIIMHSDSKGAAGSWELEAVIVDFPIDNYFADVGETTDWDGDGDFDWLDTNDGRHEMIITDDGTVHVFSGRMQIRDIAAATGFFYDVTKAGIYHWKTGDASATLHDEFAIDWNGDGNPFSGITEDLDAYNFESFTFMPTAAYDAEIDRVYLAYMMPVEDEVSASDQNYADLFGTYSDDGGETWSDPINLSYSAFKGMENAYASAHPMMINNKFQVMWQQDDEPGTSQDPAPSDDDIQTNNIVYVAWDSTRFKPYNPTVDFSYVVTMVGADFSVAFTNLSVDAEEYFWEFDDGGTSALTNPTHVFDEGIYEVCLTAYNHYGEATHCEEIVAGNAPVADFIHVDITDPIISFFDNSTGGTPTSWFWEFGDGATATTTDAIHTYTENGIYNACLTVSNVAGEDTYCENITIDGFLAPTANFSFSGDPTVFFTDLSTGGPTEWDWEFGDGGFSSLENPSHTYLENGTYEVCLTVSNIFGPNTSCQNVVIDAYPEAAFTFTDADPLISFFDASTGDVTGFAWDWDFGDGGSSTLENPTHTYDGNGTYEVCLTASNIYGSSTTCDDVTIDSYLEPVVIFEYEDAADPTIIFTDLSTGEPFEWDWDFGDGGTSVLQDPVHEFSENGSFEVCLTATNEMGSSTGCQIIVVDGYLAPEALFTYSEDPVVTFTDLSSNDPTEWLWDFDDGTFSTEQDPVHAFTENGTYTVCLTASGPGGTDDFCDNIDIESAELAPDADFSYAIGDGFTVDFTDLSLNDPTSWAWDFGDETVSSMASPTHTYAAAGDYNVCLTATNDIDSDTECKVISVQTGTVDLIRAVNIYPVPASEYITIDLSNTGSQVTVGIENMLGEEMPLYSNVTGQGMIMVDVRHLPSGSYLLRIATDLGKTYRQIIIE